MRQDLEVQVFRGDVKGDDKDLVMEEDNWLSGRNLSCRALQVACESGELFIVLAGDLCPLFVRCTSLEEGDPSIPAGRASHH